MVIRVKINSQYIYIFIYIYISVNAVKVTRNFLRHVNIFIVEFSSVNKKNVFTKLFELCEWRNLGFYDCNTAANANIAVAVLYFALILRYML